MATNDGHSVETDLAACRREFQLVLCKAGFTATGPMLRSRGGRVGTGIASGTLICVDEALGGAGPISLNYSPTSGEDRTDCRVNLRHADKRQECLERRGGSSDPQFVVGLDQLEGVGRLGPAATPQVKVAAKQLDGEFLIGRRAALVLRYRRA